MKLAEKIMTLRKQRGWSQEELAQLLADGLLISDTPKGPVRMGLPLDALGVLLPNLYPEAVSSMLDY